MTGEHYRGAKALQAEGMATAEFARRLESTSKALQAEGMATAEFARRLKQATAIGDDFERSTRRMRDAIAATRPEIELLGRKLSAMAERFKQAKAEALEQNRRAVARVAVRVAEAMGDDYRIVTGHDGATRVVVRPR